ncbi:hypothetical protein Pfo_028923 [Paulownia fortunei]|nr:hypothetical protein Pfo_028923 [Paulownia fortunei]
MQVSRKPWFVRWLDSFNVSMAPLPKNSIDHFAHPGHPLTAFEGDKEYLCDGCKTLGTGKRYRCHGCDFDLHDYCGTCPRVLSSFMHQNHALSLVIRKAQGTRQVDRICDVCADPVEGLFYRCKECEFDVHPLCTQLPQKLQHALHKIHPLNLQSWPVPGLCAVCRGLCNSWRYRCGICNFDIHLECVLVPVVPCPQNAQTNQRGIPIFDQGIPFQPRPNLLLIMGSLMALVIILLDLVLICTTINTCIQTILCHRTR